MTIRPRPWLLCGALLMAAPPTLATDVTTATVKALPPLGPAPVAPPVTAPAETADAARDRQAPAGLRRCVAADGSSVFTDRRCDLLGATPEVVPPPGATPTPQVLRVRTCARNQGDLLEGVRMALEARDANRFAEFYHWSGMDNAQGYQVMGRLMSFTERPLIDVQLVSSAARQPAPPPFAARRPFDPDARDPRFDDAEPAPAATLRADLLRVDQLRGDDAIETDVTWFHLRSNAGCWWLQF